MTADDDVVLRRVEDHCDDVTGRSGGLSDANSRTVSAGDARLSTRRHLYVHVHAFHRLLLDGVSITDHHRSGHRAASSRATLILTRILMYHL